MKNLVKWFNNEPEEDEVPVDDEGNPIRPTGE